MKLRIFTLIAILVVLGGYIGRGYVRDAWYEFRQPTLPEARPFAPVEVPNQAASTTAAETSPFEPGYSTSEHFVLETTPPVQKPSVPVAMPSSTAALPTEMNLAVPFITQAPKGNWGMPFQEACEEAASLMVDRFYQGMTSTPNDDLAQGDLIDMVEFQKMKYGFYEDSSATETVRLIQDYFGYEDVRIEPLKTPDDIKHIVAAGYPVIIPTAGKLLHNPFFSNGGPRYHMVVVRGYTPTHVITNDPGLRRKGKEYVYTYDTLLNAAHDWNGGNVQEGDKVMIVVAPKRVTR